MNRYTIESDGKRYTVEADSEEQALALVSGNTPAPKTDPLEVTRLDRMKAAASELGGELAGEFKRQYVAPVQQVASGNVKAGLRDIGQTLGPSVRMSGQAVALSPQFQAMSIPAQVATGFLAGYGADTAGQAMMGENNRGEAYAAGVFGMLPSVTPNSAAAGFAEQRLQPGTLASGLRFLKEVGRDIGTIVGINSAAELTKRSVNEGRPVNFESFRDFWTSNSIPMAIGVGLGTARQFGETSQAYRQAADQARKDIMETLGADEMTLANIAPQKWAEVEARLAQSRPALAEKINKQYGSFTKAWSELFGNAASDAEIGNMLQTYVGALGRKREELAAAENATMKAEEALMQARNSNVDRFTLAQIQKEAAVARINEVRARATERLYKTMGVDKAGIARGSDAILEDFNKSFDDLITARKRTADDLFSTFYKEAGITPFSPQIVGEDLVRNAEEAFIRAGRMPARGSGEATPIAVQQVLDRIKSFTNQFKEEAAPILLDASGRAIKTPQRSLISIEDVRELRNYLREGFAGADEKTMAAKEALNSIAYGGVNDAVTNSVKGLANSRGNPAIAEAWDAANGYWRETSQMLDSPYIYNLTKPDQRASTFKSLASQVAAGDKTAIQGFQKLVDSIASGDPAVAGLARAAMTRTMRDSFILNATEANGVNFGKLAESLSKSANSGLGDSALVAMGFGNRAQLREMVSLAEKYSPTGKVVSADMLKEVYSNPAVQDALLAGRSVSAAAREPMAKAALLQQIKADVLKAKVGARNAKFEGVIRQREQLMKEAKMTEDQLAREVYRMEGDDMFKILEGTTLGLPDKAGQSTGGFARAIMSMTPVDARQVMGAIRKNYPKAYESIQGRVIADTLETLFTPSARPNMPKQINAQRVEQFFSPMAKRDAGSQVAMLENVLDEKTFGRLQNLTRAMSRVANQEKLAVRNAATPEAVTAAGIGMAGAQGKGGASAIFISGARKIYELVQGGKHLAVSRIVTDPEFSKAYFDAGGDIEKLISTGIGQRLMLKLTEQEREELLKK